MREAMLIIHFVGLAMGLGTSFGFMFLGMAASKMNGEEAKKFTLDTFALSRMGHIGIVLLLISGIYLIIPYWPMVADYPLLITKLVLVLLLVLLIVLLGTLSAKAKKGDFERQSKKIRALGMISMLTALAIVVLAVLTFR